MVLMTLPKVITVCVSLLLVCCVCSTKFSTKISDEYSCKRPLTSVCADLFSSSVWSSSVWSSIFVNEKIYN